MWQAETFFLRSAAGTKPNRSDDACQRNACTMDLGGKAETHASVSFASFLLTVAKGAKMSVK